MAPKVEGGAIMNMTSSTIFKVSVLRFKKTGRVLYLEAGKDFVDTLFSFLLLPIGTIIYLLKNAGQVKALGGISNIYESIEKVDCSFLRVDKQSLLQPIPAAASTSWPTGLVQALEALKFKIKATAAISSLRIQGYRPLHNMIGSSLINGGDMSLQSPPNSEGEGFVRENITYMVTDNLEVVPSQTTKIIKLFNEFKVATFADLECTDVNVTVTQVFQLLQAALTSSSSLNEVFGKI